MVNAWHKKEADRVNALKRYNVLDTAPDKSIDRVVKAAAAICETPIALVSLVDTDRQWVKASWGISVSETPREYGFCSHAIEEPGRLMVVEDATKDSRFIDNPMVTGAPNVRFYSGQTLLSPDGHALGTLCVIDDKPRQLTNTQKKALLHLADVVTDLLGKQEKSFFTRISLAVEQSLQLGITITDLRQENNPMVYCNKALESMSGYSQEELLGRNCRFFQGENTDSNAVTELRNAVAEKREVTVELRNYRKDGAEFWNEITVAPIVNKTGVTTHFLGILKDVSERHKTEAALSQSRAFIESAPDAMIVSNREGDIVLANTQAVRMFGYTHEELCQMSVDDLMVERIRQTHKMGRQDYFDSLESNRSVVTFNSHGLTKSKQEIPVEARLSPVITDDEILVSASIRNVSKKLAAEFALRKSEERYRDLFENSTDLIQSVNPKGAFSYTNPAWLNAFGYTKEEVSKLHIRDLIYPDNFEYSLNVLDRVIAGESIPHVEMVFKTKAGEPVYLEGSVSTSMIDGEVKAVRTIFRDVTQRNEIERLLVLSKESAESATSAKSRFLAAASHDLRQPLQSASMYVATLARQFDKSEDAIKLCDMAAKSLDSMGRLLDVLLDLTTLDSGSITPEKKDIPIQSILDNIVTSSQQQAQLKGLRFNCECQDGVVHTDPALLERILENFVSNAIRYTEYGDVNIRCHYRNQEVLISVSDSGVGIPIAKQDDVFEEYFQLDNDERDRSKGLGLGLSIVRRIANLLDYPLEVSSEPGQGSTFSVLVPLGESKRSATLVAEAVVTKQESLPIILLVDDDEFVLKSTARLLNAYDMEVHSAVNGDDALSAIAKGLNPDFLLSDFRLPGYDGIELVMRVRDALSRDIPTVLMTGDTSTAKIKEAQLPSFTMLHKPVDIQKLLKLIVNSVE